MNLSNLPNQVLAELGAETFKALNCVVSALALHCSMPGEHFASSGITASYMLCCLSLTNPKQQNKTQIKLYEGEYQLTRSNGNKWMDQREHLV